MSPEVPTPFIENCAVNLPSQSCELQIKAARKANDMHMESGEEGAVAADREDVFLCAAL